MSHKRLQALNGLTDREHDREVQKLSQVAAASRRYEEEDNQA